MNRRLRQKRDSRRAMSHALNTLSAKRPATHPAIEWIRASARPSISLRYRFFAPLRAYGPDDDVLGVCANTIVGNADKIEPSGCSPVPYPNDWKYGIAGPGAVMLM